MNTIESIVQQAMQAGSLTAVMEADISRMCDKTVSLSYQDYKALDMLMGAMLTHEVVTASHKEFINVMEELVLTEAVTRIGAVEASHELSLDLGDITAYALNRLPPLYATSEEGTRFQREHTQACLRELIIQQVDEAISHSLHCPNFFPERQAINQRNTKTQGAILEQVASLLQTQLPESDEANSNKDRRASLMTIK